MRGPRIPTAKRIVNDPAFPPINPADYAEANADHLMFLWDNMGTGEFLEDAAILIRHLKQLLAREQVTPNLTLEVLAGIGWFAQNAYVDFVGGNSPSFTAPAANPRIDVLTLRNDGILYRIAGVEAAVPVAPTIPSTDIPICQVYNVVGQTKIHDNDTQEAGHGFIQFDLRPFLQGIVGASAMPKIGIVARAQATATALANTLETVVSFSGAGRLRGIHMKKNTAGSLKVTIDGVVVLPETAGPGAENDVKENKSDLTQNLKLVASTEDPANNIDIFFKSSLLVQHNSNAGASGPVTTVNWEHE